MFQTPWFLFAVTVGPVVYARMSPPLRVWLLAALSLIVVASADVTALLVVALACLAWWRSGVAVPALLALRPLAVALVGAGGPLGASYVAFRAAHVAIDVRRGAERPAFPPYLAWILFFPIWSAGPIARYDSWAPGLRDGPQPGDWIAGWQRIAVGVCKKAIGADLVAAGLAEHVRGGRPFAAFAPHEAWAYAVLLFAHGYLDFSAYSDVAIGAGRVFGFRVPENFNFPFVATSLADFWRRWHMTLLAFCQRYVYLPAMGFTRSPYLASLATFGVMGLWHGPSWSWMAWGLWHATGVNLQVAGSRLWRERGWPWPGGWLASIAGWMLTFLWIVPAAAFSGTREGLGAALVLLGRLAGLGG